MAASKHGGITEPKSEEDPIVITGISGRFPESDNLEELKENLFAGIDMVTSDDRRFKSCKSSVQALNDDLPSTFTVHQVAETRLKIDSPINDPDAILQIMFSGRHTSVSWTIMGRSSLCYLMNG